MYKLKGGSYLSENTMPITKFKWLIMFRQIIADNCENNTWQLHTLRG